MERTEQPVTFGGWLERRRKSLDLTQEELAQRAGCSVFAIRKIESGERRPSKQLAGLLGTALEIPLSEQPTFIKVARGDLNFERLGEPDRRAAHAHGLATGGLTTGKGPPGEKLPEPTTTAVVRIPVLPTALVGREAELAAIERLMGEALCQLLTITGLGGTGKTRLAIAYAATRYKLYPAGVYFVPLAAVNTTDLIVLATADALGLVFSGPSDPKDQLFHFLKEQSRAPMLLILDNLEHLLADQGTIELMGELLGRLPNLKILATSRERLNLQGEWIFELHGLPVPQTGADGIGVDNSAALFVQSARRVKADFAPDGEKLPEIVQICRLVEGSPLAVELAAAWVGVLSIREIADEIKNGLDLLTTSKRDVPERHRSMHAVFDHSWKLLSEEEQRVMRQMSIFRGGVTRAAAGQVAGASLPVLAALASKSLLQHNDNGRFDLHELVRQYACLQMKVFPEEERLTCERHSDYYLGLLRDREADLKGLRQAQAIRELTDESENVRAAWAWAVQNKKLRTLVEAVRAFGELFEVAGWLHDGIEQLQMAVDALTPPQTPEEEADLGRVLPQQGLLYFRLGQFDRAIPLYETSLAILRRFENPVWLIDPLIVSSVIKHLMGDMDEAQRRVREGLACAEAAGDEWFRAYALFNIGYMDSLNGRYDAGTEKMIEGLALWRRVGEPRSIAMGLNYLSPTLIRQGRYAEARKDLEESLELCSLVGDRWGQGTALRQLGHVALAEGKFEEAQRWLQQSLKVFYGFVTGWDIVRSQIFIGMAAAASGDIEKAWGIYRDAVRMGLEEQSAPLSLEATEAAAGLLADSGKWQEALALCLFVLRQRESLYETKERATQLAAKAREKLDEDQMEVATLRSEGLTWGIVMAELANRRA